MGVEKKIFEKVPDGDSITCCSPLVVQPKPKHTEVAKQKLQPQMIRASIDMRIPNQSMKRSRCVQAPRIEDFDYHLHDCKIFKIRRDKAIINSHLALDPERGRLRTSNYQQHSRLFL